MKRQEKGLTRRSHEMLKTVPTATATKKKAKTRIGKRKEEFGKVMMIEEKRDNDDGEFAEILNAEEVRVVVMEYMWDELPMPCLLCAVVEQMSWGTCWSPFWDVELMSSAEACHAFCSDVFWDDDIWDMKDFKDYCYCYTSPSP